MDLEFRRIKTLVEVKIMDGIKSETREISIEGFEALNLNQGGRNYPNSFRGAFMQKKDNQVIFNL